MSEKIRSYLSINEIIYIASKINKRSEQLKFPETNHLIEKRMDLFKKLIELKKYNQEEHLGLNKVRWPPIFVEDLIEEVRDYLSESYNYELIAGG